jgi:hypothetical protein
MNAKWLIVVVALVFNGCALLLIPVGAGIGFGTYFYLRGEVGRGYGVKFEHAFEAVASTITKLKYTIRDTHDVPPEGWVKSTRPDGTFVDIYIKWKSENWTEIRIRVGFPGDRGAAIRLHEEIARRLKKRRR